MTDSAVMGEIAPAVIQPGFFVLKQPIQEAGAVAFRVFLCGSKENLFVTGAP
jgi:hypothetical protein